VVSGLVLALSSTVVVERLSLVAANAILVCLAMRRRISLSGTKVVAVVESTISGLAHVVAIKLVS
jgi:hypothetical protein